MNEMLNNPFGLTKTEIYVFGLGREHEQERIIKLLEEHTINGKHGVTPHGNSHFWEMGMKYAIALIKGEQDEDACEPSDSPCVNGWSCQKHKMTIEQMTDFIALIKGEK